MGTTVADVVDDRKQYRVFVASVAERAKAHLPEAINGRLASAVTMVLAGDVETQADGSILVGSRTDPQATYRLTGQDCPCQDFTRGNAPEGWCAHRIAAGIAKRAQQELEAADSPGVEPAPDHAPEGGDLEDWPDEDHIDPGRVAKSGETVAPAVESVTTIPRQFITVIKGKNFVQYVGLLAMAHERGLAQLQARFVSVTPALAVAEATATFRDGGVFSEAADATPENVNKGVRDHFARCALTRAKARALRDALNIGICSVEEMA